jgi:heme-binding protein
MPVIHLRSGAACRRRFPAALAGVLVASALGGAAAVVLSVPAATAAPDPCAASEVAKTVATVATNTGSYLDLHPQTNQALTTISQQPAGPQTLTSLKTYFDANPQAAKDLQTIQTPLTSMSTRCKLPISMPQALGLMQAAQQGGLPGSLAGAAQTVAGAGVPAGTGPAPGPAAAVPAATAPRASSAVPALP